MESLVDDTNVLFTSDDLHNLEFITNHELKQIYKYCAINKLSKNFAQTIFMLILSPRYHPTINIDNIEPSKLAATDTTHK